MEEKAIEVRAKAEENLQKANEVVNKLFLTEKDEYVHLKAVFGAAAGVVAGGVLYMLLYFMYKIPALLALYITLPCMIIICIGLALWTPFRAVFALALPTTITDRGRTSIYTLIFALLLTGPVANMSANLHQVSNTLACR